MRSAMIGRSFGRWKILSWLGCVYGKEGTGMMAECGVREREARGTQVRSEDVRNLVTGLWTPVCAVGKAVVVPLRRNSVGPLI